MRHSAVRRDLERGALAGGGHKRKSTARWYVCGAAAGRTMKANTADFWVFIGFSHRLRNHVVQDRRPLRYDALNAAELAGVRENGSAVALKSR